MSKKYVDNKRLYSVLVEYKEKQEEAIDKDKERPRIPEYVGECILLIARRLSTKSQFYNYPYKEDMISDGLRIVYSTWIILIPISQRTHLHISRR